MYDKIGESAQAIQNSKPSHPKVGIVLGSGLGAFVDRIESPTIIPYKDIPHFHDTTVEGHEGRLILGKIGDTEVIIQQGRLHAYEGHPMEEVVLPVRVMATLGIESLILTNASGGINLDYSAGNLVCIRDHINLMGRNPLVGPNNNEKGPRFPDMTSAYAPELRELILNSAKNHSIDVKEGVYAGVLGPTYETPAEIHMLRTIGADMVGMSTVPECIAANHLGVKVAGISCVTNMAAGIEAEKLDHADIKEQALKVMDNFSQLLLDVVTAIK
ncbi:MAG: purine-nucleoside phosphorylase [Bacteriovoracaceae bacterium]